MINPAPDHAALYQQECQAREQAETWMRVAARLNSPLDLGTALSAVCQVAADMLAVPIVTISLYDAKREELSLAYAHGLPPSRLTQAQPLPRQVYDQFRREAGQVVTVADIQSLPDLPNSDMYRELDLRTTVGISMMLAETQLIGRLNIGTIGAERVFSEREIELLRGIANQAAVAIHRATLYDEVQRYAAELEQRVAERTADLHTKNHELQQRNQELDAFSHTVAHDLRTPLGAVTGYLDLLIEQLAEMDTADAAELRHQTAEIGDFLGRVRRQAHNMGGIIDELLLLASVRQTEVRVRPIRHMERAVQAAWERLELQMSQQQAQLHLPTHWPVVVGHAPWLEEVWANYLSNGLKYGGRPPHLTIIAEQLPSGWVRYGLQDNGEGLTAEQTDLLFAPFTRLHHKRVQGMGLGLSIVARIVDKLGGRVGVESVVGQGSLFYFELPAA